MKKIFLSGLLLAAAWVSHAQLSADIMNRALVTRDTAISFDSAVAYLHGAILAADPTDTLEGSASEEFSRWAQFMDNRLTLQAPQDSGRFSGSTQALRYYLKNQDQYCEGEPNPFKGSWKNIGPIKPSYLSGEQCMGRVQAIWADPNTSGHLLIGANTGGVWETNDDGQNWHNISDGSEIPGTMGVHNLTVNPTNADMIYVCGGVGGAYLRSWGYGTGVYYSTDAGQTWHLDEDIDSLIGSKNGIGAEVARLEYMPGTDKLFAIFQDMVLYKPSSASAWQRITPGIATGSVFTDMHFSILNPGKLVVSTNTNNNDPQHPLASGIHSDFWVYDTNPATPIWTDLQIAPGGHIQGVSSQGLRDGIINFAISGQDNIFFGIGLDTGHTSLLMKTPVTSVSLSTKNNTYPWHAIAVSPTNENTIYAARTGDVFNVSHNAGISFHYMSGNSHIDGRCLYILSSPSLGNTDGINDVVYGGCDGGISEKRAGDTNFVSITGNGLIITEFYGMSNKEEGEDNVMIAGAQDNGELSYIRERSTPWIRDQNYDEISDGFLSKFARDNSDVYYYEYNFPSFYRREIDGITVHNTSPTNNQITNDACDPDYYWNGCNNILRPLFFSKDNAHAFVGFRTIWEQALTDTSWIRAFLNDPRDQMNVADFIFSDDESKAYVAYRGSVDTNASGNGNPYGRLYYTNNVNPATPPILWSNISPAGMAYNGRINDIETDPNNFDRIWVALGDVNWYERTAPPDSIVGRVFYSDDHGQSWNDISKGLPPLPINKILYQKGSDDVLFAATDVGVFRWNKSQAEWTCFNDGIPPVVVTSMEFNYCAGVLRAATFGRGIWETPIFPYDDVPGESDSITTNTTWSSEKYVAASVRVTSGHTLTIQNTGGDTTVIHMSRNAYIVVEPNATLNVYGAKITNDCDNCMWKGILTQGDRTMSQTPTNQPSVNLDNAVIEHARRGVCNWNESIPGSSTYYTGAIINAANTMFLNCNTGAKIDDYSYNGQPYQAEFSNCTFAIDDNYRGHNTGYAFHTGARLTHVNNVKFLGCSFHNWDSHDQNRHKGYGISAVNAGFSVLPRCTSISLPCTSYQRSTFTGLGTGIDVAGTLSPYYTSLVDAADFDSCTIGVKTLAYNNMVTVHSTFSVGNGAPAELYAGDCHQNVGIWSVNSEIFNIEGNTFTGHTFAGQPSDMQNLGVVVQQSGENYKEVYRNTFTDLTKACWGVNDNAHSTDGNLGLTFKCNTYTGNEQAIAVSADASHGIAHRQGYFAQAAGNTFGTGHNYMKNDGRDIRYYYTFGTGEAPNPIAPLTQVTPSITINSHTCPDHYTGKLDGGFAADVKVLWADLHLRHATAQDDYHALINCGSTAELGTFLSTMTPDSAAPLKARLLSCSPYLTQPVLAAVAATDILSSSDLKDVLGANPEMLHDSAFLAYFEYEIPTPLSGGDIADLQDSALHESARGLKESEIAVMADSMAFITNMLLTDMKLDTTGTLADSIPVLLRKIDAQWADYDLAGYYFSLQQYDSSQAVLDRIDAKYGFTTLLTAIQEDTTGTVGPAAGLDKVIDLLNYVGFNYLHAIIANAKTEARFPDSLSEDEQLLLKDIAKFDDILPCKPSAIAKRILGHASPWELSCIEIRMNPGDIFKNKAGRPGSTNNPNPKLALQDKALDKLVNTYRTTSADPKRDTKSYAPEKGSMGTPAATANQLKVYPNPASDYVVFEYRMPKADGQLQLSITDTRGIKLQQFSITEHYGITRWETKGITPGVYYYQLMDTKKILRSGKVVIIK